ncbi:hypothetical protein CLORAM_02838 [Thomasclavelia ramosa DSM 1402]|uniref:Uncharacterized protein n=1 Tax=Thomasclavelia ramosa DSM 1402 TaxID=445974 RepID=B0N8A5_9FIRM|nr:hypothetical protein CLORAM_02838 [Thomasclavelia ramosa DSM 1402]
MWIILIHFLTPPCSLIVCQIAFASKPAFATIMAKAESQF